MITISAIRIRGGTGITIVAGTIGAARMVGIDRIRVVDLGAGPVMVDLAMVDLVMDVREMIGLVMVGRAMVGLVMVGLVIRMGVLAGPALRLLEMDQSRARVNTRRGVV